MGSPRFAVDLLPDRPRQRPAIINPTSLVAWTIPWQLGGRDTLTVVVKASCDLAPDAPAALRSPGAPPSGDLHQDDDETASLCYPSDFAALKPRADVVLHGSAYAPEQGTGIAQVVFRFGAAGNAFERRAVVFGARHWQGSGLGRSVSEPEPFESIPLVYERAFGGPSFDANPIGVGHRAAAGPDGVAPLPNIEDPEQLIASPSDAPAPMAFAAIAPSWASRWSKLGTFDRSWLEQRWPYYPDDADLALYQAAPLEQQLGYLRGDEPYEVSGVRPDQAVLRGSLPGLRPRVFACQRDDEDASFVSVRLHLDTVVIDAETMTMQLLWRGLLEVSAATAPEIAAIYVLTEPLDEPLEIEQAFERYQIDRARSEIVLAPKIAAATAAANDVPEESSEAAEALRAKLEQAGIPAEWFADDLAPAVVKPDEETIEQALRSDGADDEAVRRVLGVLAVERGRADGLRARAEVALAGNQPLDGIDLQGADLSELDFAGRSLKGANLKDADLTGAVLTKADLGEAQLGGACLRRAALEAASLCGADLTGVVLDQADLSNAKLDAARLVRARGQGARFAKAEGAGVGFVAGDWSDAVFEGAQLEGADFSQATLDRARFDGAGLPNLRLYDARGTEVSFRLADLSGARADCVQLLQSSLRGAKAPGSVWDDARLDDSELINAELGKAAFCGASCRKTIFSRADLRQAQFRAAVLVEASFLKSDLMEASFEDADLTGADLRGANLYSAETWRARLDGVDLDQAYLVRSKLEGRS